MRYRLIKVLRGVAAVSWRERATRGEEAPHGM